jgi:hypothetical protein
MHLRRAAQSALIVAVATCTAVPLQAQSASALAQSGSALAQSATLRTAESALLPATAAPKLAESAALQEARGWTSLRVAKWTTAGLAAGAAVYGVLNNRKADDEYEQLEQVCVVQPERCGERLPGGAYADADMEAQYQNIRALDRRARTALIAGQVGIAAAVLLFVLDLRHDDGPANIPYDPDLLDIVPARDGGMSLSVQLRLPGG